MKWWIFFIIISALINRMHAQQSGDLLNNAAQLILYEEDSAALKEYLRVLYFFPEKSVEAYEGLAECYCNLNVVDKAMQYYDAASLVADDTLYKEGIALQKINCLLSHRMFELAVLELRGLNNLSEENIKRANFLAGIAFYGLADFEQAEQYFLLCVEEDSIVRADLTDLFGNKRNLKNPSPAFAKLMSAAIPGSGQFLSKKYFSGVNSFILVSSLSYLVVYVAIRYSYIDAFIGVFPWWQRYYVGGIRKAGEYAIHKRDERRQLLLNDISNLIQYGTEKQDR